MNTKPNFLIVGAMKAGTTSLAYILAKHKDISIPKQEINFFYEDHLYNKGKTWYLKHFNRDKKLVGEKAPIYMYIPKCAERIYKYNPNIKLIFLLRDPIKRAYSNYVHHYKQGIERMSFECAVKKEKERIKKNIFNGYCKRSLYIEQIKIFLQYFNREQMHFIIFEEMITQPKEVLTKVYSFLGITNLKDEQFIIENNNPTKIPRFMNIQRSVAHIFSNHTQIIKMTYELNKLIWKPSKEKIPANIIKMLKRYFNPYNLQLGQLLNKDISNHWY